MEVIYFKFVDEDGSISKGVGYSRITTATRSKKILDENTNTWKTVYKEDIFKKVETELPENATVITKEEFDKLDTKGESAERVKERERWLKKIDVISNPKKNKAKKPMARLRSKVLSQEEVFKADAKP